MSATHSIPLLPGVITVEEFEAMDLPESCEWELIDGTVVSVTFPDVEHGNIQHRVYDLLKNQLRTAGGERLVIRLEYGYALGTRSRFRADVAVIEGRRNRASTMRLEGAPELVVEVMSRSNTEAKIDRLQLRCFERGCALFLRIYPRKRRAVLATPDSNTEYGGNDAIRFELFGMSVVLSLIDIFEDFSDAQSS